MSDIKLKTLKFEGLAGTYVLPEIPETLVTQVEELETKVGDTAVAQQIDDAIENHSHNFYTVSETAPSDTSLLWLKPV